MRERIGNDNMDVCIERICNFIECNLNLKLSGSPVGCFVLDFKAVHAVEPRKVCSEMTPSSTALDIHCYRKAYCSSSCCYNCASLLCFYQKISTQLCCMAFLHMSNQLGLQVSSQQGVFTIMTVFVLAVPVQVMNCAMSGSVF